MPEYQASGGLSASSGGGDKTGKNHGSNF